MRKKLDRLWPLALCIAIGLSCNLGYRAGESGDRKSGGSSDGGRSSDSGELAGSIWKGTFKCSDGDEIPANYRFAESGNPIYEYQSKSGAREVELSESGQTIRFVPPGGGVTTVVLDEISVSPERISHTMRVSREQASGETLDQSSSTIHSEAVLSGGNLDVEFSISSQGVLSQPGIMVPGDASTIVCQGKLRR